MKQYLDAVREILTVGTRKQNRTGVDTLSTFNVNYEIDLREGFPLLTTKRVRWKNIVVEQLWFLSGEPTIDVLRRHKCKFWDAWADKKGRVPSAYGNFWRHFPVHERTLSVHGYTTTGAYNDQLAWIVNTLINNPMSRRMVVSAWAPGNAQTSKLPPCHITWVVNVQLDENGEQMLCLHLTQRSCDIALGVPYNIASYALLLHLLSRFSGIKPGIFGHTLIDAHTYTSKPDGSMAEYDHVPGLREQLTREPRTLPRIEIAESVRALSDLEWLLQLETKELMRHFVLHDYNPHPAISFKVAV